jgi:DNA-binding MarR family transcriptional regulator
MPDGSALATETAIELMTAMIRLRARLRTESAPSAMPWSWSQLTTLSRIAQDGPTTTSALAKAEHVRRQSMAETVAMLRKHGLISSEEDPSDGRQTLLSATAEGRALTESIPAAREAWLNVAIETALEPAEREVLQQAAALMNRLADSDS